MSGEPLGTVLKKPLVCIVLATYNPNFTWFEEQLESLNNQTYENLKLLVLDDCSENENFEKITNYVERHITRFPYELYRNEENLGSNKTFEKLTAMAEGEYIAYCDQDDVWLAEKVEIYVKEIKRQNAILICSDMYIIDAEGTLVADSMTKVRRHHIFKRGEGLAAQLLFSNFVTGCAMLIRMEVAKQAIPFCPYMVHDHYLALCSANLGSIGVASEPLIQYRIHGNNQTSMMAGVIDKESYLEIRINLALDKMYWLEENFICEEKLKITIQQGIRWLEARKKNMEGVHKDWQIIWRYRTFSKWTAIFEIVAAHLPNRVFMLFIGLKRKNIV